MLSRLPFLALVVFSIGARAEGIRVATFNIGAQFESGGSIPYSLGDPGTPDHDRVRDILDRIDADVVALQEIATNDVDEMPSDLEVLAANLGYPYLYIAPTSKVTGINGYAAPFDTTLRVAFLSRYPLQEPQPITSPPFTATPDTSPLNSQEMTRFIPAVKVDVPGTTRDPWIISAHLKSGTDRSDRFQRAIEMRRLTNFISAKGLTADDNFVITGDFNFSSSPTEFAELPETGLPANFRLGSDISYPVNYYTNPLSYFSSPIPSRLDPRQLNGSASTFNTTSPGGSTIDLILVSPAIAGRIKETEIYNSTLDTSNTSGIPKAGSPLNDDSSSVASDHYAVFADLELDQDYPNLDLALSISSVEEGSPVGTATLTVTLPAIRASAVMVNLESDDPSALSPAASAVIIPAGELTATVALVTNRNFVVDGTRNVALSASAPGYDPDSGVIEISDADGPYVFTSPGQTLEETFTEFGGGYDPAPWTTGGGTWRGTDNGSSTLSGFRSYGPAGDSSLGFLPDGTASSAFATFTNQTSETLTTLQVSFTTEQWRAVSGGTANGLNVELIVGGVSQPIPSLSFTAATNSATGPIPNGNSTVKSALLTGLSIAPGASFDLRFNFTPGTGSGVQPSDVFINEFHYDNSSDDTGEFIEVVVAPGYTGPLSNISVVLYNGDVVGNAVVYDTLNLLSDFSLEGTSNFYQIYVANLPVGGLQNGPRDGLAVVNTATSQVLQRIAYEGSFTSTQAPAAGSFNDIGVSQQPASAAGIASLGLGGTGGVAADFGWTKFAGAFTAGQPNTGQTFTAPLQSQGISFDNLSVTFVPGGDSDGDGIKDPDELVFGSDPGNAASRYQILLTRPSVALTRLEFPTTGGRNYMIQSSDNLDDWVDGPVFSGNGSPRIVDLPVDPEEPEFFYRIRATLQ